jgi:hypothetical protein
MLLSSSVDIFIVLNSNRSIFEKSNRKSIIIEFDSNKKIRGVVVNKSDWGNLADELIFG